MRNTSSDNRETTGAETQIKIREHSLVPQSTRHQNHDAYPAEEHIRNKQVCIKGIIVS